MSIDGNCTTCCFDNLTKCLEKMCCCCCKSQSPTTPSPATRLLATAAKTYLTGEEPEPKALCEICCDACGGCCDACCGDCQEKTLSVAKIALDKAQAALPPLPECMS